MPPALDEYSHVTSWSKADKALGQKDEKIIGNNTKLSRHGDGSIGVYLHGHNVVKFHRNGDIQISSKGYHTSTTKDRLNRYTPSNVRVVQRDYEWYLKKGSQRKPFQDGMYV